MKSSVKKKKNNLNNLSRQVSPLTVFIGHVSFDFAITILHFTVSTRVTFIILRLHTIINKYLSNAKLDLSSDIDIMSKKECRKKITVMFCLKFLDSTKKIFKRRFLITFSSIL